MTKIAAVVVTYNRKELLEENLIALGKQKCKGEGFSELLKELGKITFEIIVVDNASTDGTKEVVRDFEKKHPQKIHYIQLEENLGGAGGFYHGMKEALAQGFDYVWIMDDDTIPKEDALEMLLKALCYHPNPFGFFASKVLWVDGTECLMNQVHPIAKEKQRGVIDNEKLLKEMGSPIDQASFVSLFFDSKAVAKLGLPLKEYFIWGDDKEYTLRMAKHLPCYQIPQSVVIHKMKTNAGSNITYDEVERIQRYFYAYRNDLCTAKAMGIKAVLIYFAAFGLNMARVLLYSKEGKGKRIAVMWKGMLAGVRFSPKIEFIEKRLGK